ncbi:MAG: cytochrome c maturation protein CcmE [Pseudomonadota bacterium]
MHPVRRQRLWVVLSIVVFSSAAIGLVVYALRQNINLFYPPADVVAGKAPLDTPIRVGGMVVEGSVVRSSESLEVRFEVTDFVESVTVVYDGILPDLFAEGEGVVASGRLRGTQSTDGGVVTFGSKQTAGIGSVALIADEVLAKHDENYMPPEVADALKKNVTAAIDPL